MFGLGYFLSAILGGGLPLFFVFFTIINGFVVWVGLLPLWTLVINIMICIVLIYISIKGIDIGV